MNRNRLLNRIDLMECRAAVVLQELLDAGMNVHMILDVLGRLSPPTKDEDAALRAAVPDGDPFGTGYCYHAGVPLVIGRYQDLGTMSMLAWACFPLPASSVRGEEKYSAVWDGTGVP